MSDAPSTSGGSGKFLKNVLGIIFFVILIIGGILIAVFGARTIPGLFSAGNAASVYTSSVFDQGSTTPTTTTPANNTSGTQTTSTNNTLGTIIGNGLAAPTLPKAPQINEPGTTGTTNTSSGSTQTTRVQTGRYVNVPSYSGLPDLNATIIQVGYLRTSSTNSFVESDTVPSGYNGAIRFIVANNGTNASGQWRFRAYLPSSSDGVYDSPYQNSLLPGGSVTVTLGFDNTERGSNQDIRVVADYFNQVQESNENNNSDSTTVYIR